MAVYMYLDASARHLTDGDNMDLDLHHGPGNVLAHDYGYWVSLSSDKDYFEEDKQAWQKEGYSAGFLAVMQYAFDHGCLWVKFDIDGDEIEGIPLNN